MATLEKTKSGVAAIYVGLSEQAYKGALSAMLSANRRLLDYWRAVWEINFRSLASPSPDSIVRESFERSSQLLKLTVDELEAQGQESAKFTEELASQATQVRESSLAALSGVLDMAVADLNSVKSATERNLDQLKKLLEDFAGPQD